MGCDGGSVYRRGEEEWGGVLVYRSVSGFLLSSDLNCSSLGCLHFTPAGFVGGGVCGMECSIFRLITRIQGPLTSSRRLFENMACIINVKIMR